MDSKNVNPQQGDEAAAHDLTATMKQLECPLCHEVYSRPKMLPCHHTVCQPCLQKHFKKHRTPYCPICSEVVIDGDTAAGSTKGNEPKPTNAFNINNKDAALLKDNLLMQIFLLEAKTFEDLFNKTMECSNCGGEGERRRVAEHACVDCSLFLCTECYQGHQVLRANRHNTFHISMLSENRDHLEYFQRFRVRTCEDHREAMRLYCEQDRKQLCHMCAFTDIHKGHSVISLEEQVNNEMSELDIEEDKVSEIYENIADKQDQIEEILLKIKAKNAESLQQIHEHKMHMMNLIEESSRKLEEELKAHTKQRIKSLKEKLKKTHILLDMAEDIKQEKDTLRLIPISSCIDTIGLVKSAAKERLHTMKACREFDDLDAQYHLQFVPSVDSELEKCVRVGELRVEPYRPTRATIQDNYNSNTTKPQPPTRQPSPGITVTESVHSQNSANKQSASTDSGINDTEKLPSTTDPVKRPLDPDPNDPRRDLPLKDLAPVLKSGDLVVRGPGWKAKTVADGAGESPGVVIQLREHIVGSYTVTVKWHGRSKVSQHAMNVYTGTYELKLA